MTGVEAQRDAAGSVSCRKRSTRGWVSTWLSACGWKTSEMPDSSCRTLPSADIPVTRSFHCAGSSSPGSSASPLCMSVYCSGSSTRWLAPSAPSSAASVTAVLQRLLVGLRAAVQPGEHRAAGELEATAAELVAQLLGVGRQVAVGAQLDPLVAALHDLVEELVPGHLVRVVGEPDAPRVGRGAEAQP